ncbi:MAG: alanine:cation symporter family protein [Clostridia bacterium]|nr:alanine:cation symporter family protein [Clostridia bacterium]
MEKAISIIESVNSTINEFVWVKIGIVLLIGAGILLTSVTGFFQLRYIGHWFKSTIGSVFKKSSDSTKKSNKKTVSQFQALCTALGATIGTGNIAGVSAAIVFGGPGAVFWMWVAAFFGMITKFCEITLGIYFRKKNEKGEWSGGAMYYLKDGLGSYKGCKALGSILAAVFAILTVVASFGIGNMGQINKITLNLNEAVFSDVDLGSIFGLPVLNLIIGAVLAAISAVILLGGIQRIASFAEKVVPFMAITYIVGVVALLIINFDKAGAVFASIFRFAFNNEALAGGISGAVIAQIITQGCKRGMFSNEAGLGSSVMVHSSADVTEPVKQGMWGIFEVFADTFVVCTMTAFVVLSSGFIDLERGVPLEGVSDATLVSQAFGTVFGDFGRIFVAIAILLFAFTTVIGWAQYGSKAIEYLSGALGVKIYLIAFVAVIIVGSVMESTLAWDISDTFNGLMMIPNLIGVISLTPLVIKLVKNYTDRTFKKKPVAPLLSFNREIQAEGERALSENAGNDRHS